MRFLEKDLEQIIHESGMDQLNERGLPIDGKMFRQMRIGNYGIADLITVTRPMYETIDQKTKVFYPGRITIYELKKENVSIGAFLQAIGYAKGITNYLEKRGKKRFYELDIVLIGKKIDTSGNFCFIPDILSCSLGTLNFYTYEYAIDGIFFINHQGYQYKNEGF
jgi:hypothetical protein